MASRHQASSSSSRTRSRQHVSDGGRFPLIDCPNHPDRKMKLYTANTPANSGRRFYRCTYGYKTDYACNFFMWENEYYSYLVDSGFLEHHGRQGHWDEASRQSNRTIGIDLDALRAMKEEMAKLQSDVCEIRRDVRIVKEKQEIGNVWFDHRLFQVLFVVALALCVAILVKLIK